LPDKPRRGSLGGMPTRFYSVVVDAADPAALAEWWALTLGWPTQHFATESQAGPPDGEPGVWLVFVPVNDPRTVKNRVHIDLRSGDDAGRDQLVARLLAAGATTADIGQGDVPWTVLADPEGNEFCVLEPRPDRGTGPIEAVVVDTVDPASLGRFWTHAAGWHLVNERPDGVTLRAPDGRGPALEFLRTGEPHRVKNRVHLDVAPQADDDHAAEVERLLALGARRVEVGQSASPPEKITWAVLADPEDNEFCVLSPRLD
jgi:hypothetical protein